jgi:hypothetical protein
MGDGPGILLALAAAVVPLVWAWWLVRGARKPGMRKRPLHASSRRTPGSTAAVAPRRVSQHHRIERIRGARSVDPGVRRDDASGRELPH